MARYVVRSATVGIEVIRTRQPHGEEAFFLAMGLITNTRAVFFALLNNDAKRSSAHGLVIREWKSNAVPALRRFSRIVVAARDQFTKEFATTPLVVVTTSNYAPPTHEIPIYIPFTSDIEEVLTENEIRARQSLSRSGVVSPMRIDLVRECEEALIVWQAEIATIEGRILQRQ